MHTVLFYPDKMLWNRLFTTKQNEKLGPELAKDPICGMDVHPAHAYTTELGGQTYYFCSPGCKAAFKKSKKEGFDIRPMKIRKSHSSGGGCCH